MVREGEYNLGIATYDDMDRIGIVDEEGTFIHQNALIFLIYYYLLECKNGPGPQFEIYSPTRLRT